MENFIRNMTFFLESNPQLGHCVGCYCQLDKLLVMSVREFLIGLTGVGRAIPTVGASIPGTWVLG